MMHDPVAADCKRCAPRYYQVSVQMRVEHDVHARVEQWEVALAVCLAASLDRLPLSAIGMHSSFALGSSVDRLDFSVP